jgi:BatD DUF11 like domain
VTNLNRSWANALAASLILGVFSLARAHAAAPLIYATLEPKEITLGESARLTITNLGTDSRPPPLPVVAGLQFEVIAHTHQFEMTSGTTLPSSSMVVQVTPQIAGTFTIPPVTPSAQSLVLHVKADHGASGSTGPGNTNYMIRPPVQAIAPKHGGLQLTDGAAFVRLNLPKRDVFVGESVPVDIEVGVRAGFVTSLNGLPTLHGGEFTLNNLSHQPDREEKVIDDKHFTMLTWHSALAAVKPGLFRLDVETPLTVKISTRPKGDSALDELLGDPFLQNYFGATVSKQITVSSPSTDLKVLPVPSDGRPADFTGAVGSFNVSTDITPLTAAAGDPLTVRLRVSGAGNFDRVSSEMFKHLDDWKTYPPKASFQASDAVGYRGEKTFEQPVIAPKPGAHTLPALAFSYFDPVARRFQTAVSTPITVNVASALADAAPAANAAGLAQANASSLVPPRPDHPASGALHASLVPMYFRPQFLALPSITTALFAGGWLGLRRRVSVAQRRILKAMQRHLLRLDAAAGAGDAALFFSIARAMLQEMFAARWHLAVEEVTSDEIQARLGAEGEQIRELFLLCDEMRYGNQGRDQLDFPRWMLFVRSQVSGGEAL